MTKYLILFIVCIGLNTAAQQLNDDFSDASSLSKWSVLHQIEKWPNKLNTLAIKDGFLVMEPRTSGWFNNGNAPFIYRTINGDFDVQARIKSSGLNSDISTSQWSLGGLMVRIPKNETTENWTINKENWMFMTTGVAEHLGKQVIETKYTINSRSNLKLRDAKADWITLRVVRVGNVFLMLYKYDADSNWTVHDRFYFQQWPETLQVGLNCYTSSKIATPTPWDEIGFNNKLHDNEGTLDMRLTVDYIHFKKPLISYAGNNSFEDWYNNVYHNRLADYATSNEEILRLLGK